MLKQARTERTPTERNRHATAPAEPVPYDGQEARPAMRRALDRGIAGLMAVLLALAASSCGPKLVQPAGLVSPYAGERLFAVAPPLNESGTTTIDSLRVAELFTEELEQVQGIRTLPTSRAFLGTVQPSVANARRKPDSL